VLAFGLISVVLVVAWPGQCCSASRRRKGMSPLVLFHLAALLLLGLGLYGTSPAAWWGCSSAVELMLNGAGLAMVERPVDPAADELGQLGALLVMGLALTAEATLVLAIILVVAKRWGTSDSATISSLRG
jgi:NADH-quinone oxidoreductase subunit K